MKTTSSLFLILISSLLFCSCKQETSFSFNKKMIEETYKKFPNFECSSLTSYWKMDFEGLQKGVLNPQKNTFDQSYKLIFEKRWINNLAQWVPTTFNVGGSGESMIDFTKIPVYPSCHFYLENPNSNYVSYDIEFEILVAEDERMISFPFPPEYKFVNYNRDIKQIDNFKIAHQDIYETSDLEEENYVSIKSKLRFQNTIEGLKFIESSGLEESTKSIIGFKDFYDVKVTEYLDTTLFIKTEHPNSASFGRAGICIYLDELDSMINSINITEQK
ncbi:hypothetical protein ACE193_20365 [Bernardetia sp. OM2101]|uniref:hypothetical protein n=1 Tax=Bernardetia sp. OM2101 TaxID=3344876 RepID=UPI0035CF322A